jgi:hypothetical protein
VKSSQLKISEKKQSTIKLKKQKAQVEPRSQALLSFKYRI